jgi:hypothetical protein
MNTRTHQTAPTQYVDANVIRFAYRRFGKPNGVPLLFNQHYTGTMDHWDPAVTDGFAKNREVILFNNAGISSSSGEVPATFADMGANAVDVRPLVEGQPPFELTCGSNFWMAQRVWFKVSGTPRRFKPDPAQWHSD